MLKSQFRYLDVVWYALAIHKCNRNLRISICCLYDLNMCLKLTQGRCKQAPIVICELACQHPFLKATQIDTQLK